MDEKELIYEIPKETILITPEDCLFLDKKLVVKYGDKDLLVWGFLIFKTKQNCEFINDIVAKRD